MSVQTSLEATDQISAAVQKTPHRVSLKHITDKILSEHFFTMDHALRGQPTPVAARLDVMTVCVLVMTNGFTFVGKSAPADPANFDTEVGRVHARDDAIRQIWPMEGYLLRETLYQGDIIEEQMKGGLG